MMGLVCVCGYAFVMGLGSVCVCGYAFMMGLGCVCALIHFYDGLGVCVC